MNLRFWICTIALLGSACSMGLSDSMAWRKPLPNTKAFLVTDGGSSENATVCDTINHYQKSAKQSQEGCKSFPEGLPVIIKSVAYDPSLFPIARIYIPSQKVTGYTALEPDLSPNIPSGTIVHLRNDYDIRFSTTQNILSPDSLNLGHKATVQIIRFDPSGERQFYVLITDGPHAGEKGWLSSLDTHELSWLW